METDLPPAVNVNETLQAVAVKLIVVYAREETFRLDVQIGPGGHFRK